MRAAVTFAPNERLTITPRIVYQKVKTDGWNRIDVFNILANPYTTTRPAVTLGEREQFTQLDEHFTDKFLLGDLNVNYNFGDVLAHVDHLLHLPRLDVIRDATALTASITGGTIGLPESVYTLDSPLDDAHHGEGLDRRSSACPAATSASSGWPAASTPTPSATTARTCWSPGSRTRPASRPRAFARPRTPCSSRTWATSSTSSPSSARARYPVTDRFSLTGGLRYYHFNEDKTQIFDGIFAQDNTGTSLVSQPGSTDADGVAPRLIASYKLDRQDEPERAGLARASGWAASTTR